MIKFFRKIRQNMINENKVSKYMLYAIGEIVLVVIGILIALQINNSNEQRKLNKQEHYLLLQMQEEFKQDSIKLERYVFLSGKKVKEGKLLRKKFTDKIEMREDSIIAFAFFNGKPILFNGYTPTFDELVSSGNLGVLKSDKLKNKIKNFKEVLQSSQTFMYFEAQRRKEAYNTHLYKYFNAEIMTYLWENIEFGPVNYKGLEVFNTDIDGFFNDPETLYQINTIIGVDSELGMNYKTGYTILLQRLLKELQLEIDKFND
jgi:Family of unknown function (DUF6090)